jgi:hypothetical protein
MSSYNKANRELIKKEQRKLQIEKERLHKEASVAELHQKILAHKGLNENERAELLSIKNKGKARRYLKDIKQELKKELRNIKKEKERIDHERNIALAENRGKREMLKTLINETKKIPQVEDIINSAKYILCTEKRIIQTVKPIILHLQENEFNTENLDIAKILLETRQFTRGYFSKVWKMQKPNPVYFYLKRKTVILCNGVLGFAQKYLPMLYKAVKKPEELNK